MQTARTHLKLGLHHIVEQSIPMVLLHLLLHQKGWWEGKSAKSVTFLIGAKPFPAEPAKGDDAGT